MLFYGDMDGPGQIGAPTLTNCDFVEPHNVPNDGKFDQDGIPAPFPANWRLPIDFAACPCSRRRRRPESRPSRSGVASAILDEGVPDTVIN